MANFKNGNPGCNNCCACGQICVTVKECGVLASNVTVTITQASVQVDSCVTDVTGVCCVGFPVAGSVTITATPPVGSHFNAVSTTTTLACVQNNTLTINLTLATGYTCGVSGCCPDGSAIASFLTVTLFGTTASIGPGSGGTWSGNILPLVTNACSTQVLPCPALTNQYMVPVTDFTNVVVTVNCAPAGWTVSLRYTWNSGSKCAGGARADEVLMFNNTTPCSTAGVTVSVSETFNLALSGSCVSSTGNFSTVVPDSTVDPGTGLNIVLPGGAFAVSW